MVKAGVTHFKDQPGGPGRRSRVSAERANGRTGPVLEALAAIAPAQVGPNPPVLDAIRMCPAGIDRLRRQPQRTPP